MTKRCPVCQSEYEDWVQVCTDCGASMADNGFDEEVTYDEAPSLSIEFTLLSGETITVREMLEEEATEESLRAFADELIHQMGTDAVRTFAYTWEGEFYVDAVRLHEVAALSVSTSSADEDDEEDWEE